MQGLTGKLGRDTTHRWVADRAPVEGIAEDRMPVLGEMNTDLMSAPRLEIAANQGTSVQKLDRF